MKKQKNVESNYYRDEYSVSVHIKAIRISEIDDDKLFEVDGASLQYTHDL